MSGQNQIIQWFSYHHLNGAPREASKLIHDLVEVFDNDLPESAEKSAGLRKLLEAKDCFVRAYIAEEL